MRFFSCIRFAVCALFLQGAVLVHAQPFSLQSTPPNIARWMYPFNTRPANRINASAFAAFGNIPDFDTRDGQYLLGWNTSSNIPAGQGARNYLISRVRVTLTISSEGDQYAYDDQLHDYRTYFPTNDPNYLPNTNASSPIELYGVGFRGGFTNSGGVYVPYATTNFQQGTTFFASPAGGDYTNRTAYAACFDTNGVLVDVSDNVGDDGTNELSNPFEVAPFAVGYNTNFTVGQLMPTGSQITLDLNLNDPLIYSYVQQGLNEGNLSFMVSSLVNADYLGGGSPNWPDFFTIFDQYISANEFPLLDIEGTIVRTNLDSDADGLPDDWEQFYFGQLGVGATNSSANDGISNLAKYIAGTNPTNSANNFRLLSVQKNSSVTELHFNFAPSRQYTIQWSDDLQHWQTVTNPSLLYLSDWLTKTGTNQFYPAPVYAAWRDTNAVGLQRFYRVSVQ
ncbi:MAG TPA: hypothetical protein VHG71_05615 [Verrucomicrobiae bacterium]|nr:hypothetical protein [Verrucomicrobiae bacterium]